MDENPYRTGIRPYIDEYLDLEAAKRRDYGSYWSASSAGHCYRKNIFDRILLPMTSDPVENARKQRIFTVGHIFHEWMQRITKSAGVSVEQESELIDDELHVKGHFDDLVKVNDRFLLLDYKSQSSRSFSYHKGISGFHRMQLGTYLLMLNKRGDYKVDEGRIMRISKDDLRIEEDILLYSDDLADEVTGYWNQLNKYWDRFIRFGTLPDCSCAEKENGFMAKAQYNPYYYEGSPCSIEWYQLNKDKIKIKE